MFFFFSFAPQEWHQEEPSVYMVIVGPEVRWHDTRIYLSPLRAQFDAKTLANKRGGPRPQPWAGSRVIGTELAQPTAPDGSERGQHAFVGRLKCDRNRAWTFAQLVRSHARGPGKPRGWMPVPWTEFSNARCLSLFSFSQSHAVYSSWDQGSREENFLSKSPELTAQ